MFAIIGLKNIAKNVYFDEPMKKHTSFKIGGNADCLISASSEKEITDVISYCKNKNISYMVMGNGSNMLVGDKGIRGVVIKIASDMSEIRVENTTMTAQSGVLLSKLANTALKHSLTGLEFAGGIPGSLGGGVFMNAGAYGGEMCNVVESVRYINSDGEILTAGKPELDFGYRHSMFCGTDNIIVSAQMKLNEGNSEEIKAKMSDFAQRRSEKQPLSMPSAGSTFKRPEGYFAGKLIQDCGLKGYSVGGAMVSEKHSGFVVNKGGATANDVLELIKHVQKTVENKFGVWLETEVKLVGEF